MVAPIARVKNRPTTSIMNCPITVVAEDLVYLDPLNNNAVLTAVNNAPPSPVIGFVFSKPTTTTAEVVLLGEIEFTISRGHLFVGTSGDVSLTHSVPGYLQRIGFSFGNGRIYFNPDEQRVKRI